MNRVLSGVILAEKGRPAAFLRGIFDALEGLQREWNWLITDWECFPQTDRFRRLLTGEACWLSGGELDALVQEEDVQWIWGVFSAFRPGVKREEALRFLPRVRDNAPFWSAPPVIQHPLAEIELIACDSSAVLLLSRGEEPVRRFLRAFPAARPLAPGEEIAR